MWTVKLHSLEWKFAALTESSFLSRNTNPIPVPIPTQALQDGRENGIHGLTGNWLFSSLILDVLDINFEGKYSHYCAHSV